MTSNRVDARRYCACGHPRDDHRGRGKPCWAPDCRCAFYGPGTGPLCATCGHPGSFHATRDQPGSACAAGGCHCDSWQGAPPSPADPTTAPGPTEAPPTNPGLLCVSTPAGAATITVDLAAGDQVNIRLPQRGPTEIHLSRPPQGTNS